MIRLDRGQLLGADRTEPCGEAGKVGSPAEAEQHSACGYDGNEGNHGTGQPTGQDWTPASPRCVSKT